MLRKFVGFNFKVSQAVDKLWPADMRVEGSRHYRTQVLPAFITPGSNIWDLGSGRYPQIAPTDKKI